MQPLTGQTQPLPELPATAEYYPNPPAPPVSGAAIAALVFSILGLIGFMPLLGSLLAFAFAARARREAAGGTTAGAEIARAARILAWTGIALILIVTTAVVGYLAATGRLDEGLNLG